MIRTLEAVVDQAGDVTVLSKIRLKQKRRALVTILDEEPRSLTPSIQEPTFEPVDDSEILGLWADREESAIEIARRIREANRRVT